MISILGRDYLFQWRPVSVYSSLAKNLVFSLIKNLFNLDTGEYHLDLVGSEVEVF